MGWYIVIKTIRGHAYRYWQRIWRAGKHVRTESVYLRPAGRDAGETEGANPRPRVNM